MKSIDAKLARHRCVQFMRAYEELSDNSEIALANWFRRLAILYEQSESLINAPEKVCFT